MNEEAFTDEITKLFSRRSDVSVGIGDDAAAVDLNLPGGLLLLAAADQVICGIHYTEETPPEAVAAKLLKRNLSDIAAMGGTAAHALVTIAGKPLTEDWLRRFHTGLETCAKEYGVSVIGGDVSSLPVNAMQASLTILGTVNKDHIALRENAKDGDWLYCTGEIGNSFYSQHHLTFHPRMEEGPWLAKKFTRCMMDISDGLLKDALRIARSSKLAVELFPDQIPLRQGAVMPDAMSDGEDYELIFAVSPDLADRMEQEWHFKTKLTRIGRFIKGPVGTLHNDINLKETGYDHLA